MLLAVMCGKIHSEGGAEMATFTLLVMIACCNRFISKAHGAFVPVLGINCGSDAIYWIFFKQVEPCPFPKSDGEDSDNE